MVRFLSDVLATYRVTKLVIDDEITAEIRDAILKRVSPQSKIAYFLSCPWCVSVWAGLAVFSLRRLDPYALADIVSGALAASAVTGLIEERL